MTPDASAELGVSEPNGPDAKLDRELDSSEGVGGAKMLDREAECTIDWEVCGCCGGCCCCCDGT